MGESLLLVSPLKTEQFIAAISGCFSEDAPKSLEASTGPENRNVIPSASISMEGMAFCVVWAGMKAFFCGAGLRGDLLTEYPF